VAYCPSLTLDLVSQRAELREIERILERRGVLLLEIEESLLLRLVEVRGHVEIVIGLERFGFYSSWFCVKISLF
jgi:hypothetical protein